MAWPLAWPLAWRILLAWCILLVWRILLFLQALCPPAALGAKGAHTTEPLAHLPPAALGAQGGHSTVVIDVNWRPVFWDDEAAAKAAVLEYIQQAHILKVTDEVQYNG